MSGQDFNSVGAKKSGVFVVEECIPLEVRPELRSEGLSAGSEGCGEEGPTRREDPEAEHSLVHGELARAEIKREGESSASRGFGGFCQEFYLIFFC